MSEGNAVRLLVDGADSFGAILDLIRRTERHVRLENFIFRADSVGGAFASELRLRSEAGVRVQVLHDPVGAILARRLPADLLFRGSAAEAALFNLGLPTRDVCTRGRDHRKLVIADDRAMIAG